MIKHFRMLFSWSLLLPILHPRLCLGTPANVGPDGSYRAPLYGASEQSVDPELSDTLAKKYMVMFKQDSDCYTPEHHWDRTCEDLSSSTDYAYLPELSGYTASMDSITLDAIRQDPNVAFVEASRTFRAGSAPNLTTVANSSFANGMDQSNKSRGLFTRGLGRKGAEGLSDGGWKIPGPSDIIPSLHAPPGYGFQIVNQLKAPWNLAVIGIDQEILSGIETPPGKPDSDAPVDHRKFTYNYMVPSGEGVTAYILDSGVDIGNKLFGNRASNIEDEETPQGRTKYVEPEESLKDYLGRGTQLAGVVGADDVGIARQAKLVSVKVINRKGEFDLDLLVKALDALIAKHESEKARLGIRNFKGSVLVTSVGDPNYYTGPGLFDDQMPSLYRALSKAIEAGIVVSVPCGGLWAYHGPRRLKDVSWLFGMVAAAAIDPSYSVQQVATFTGEAKYLAPGVFIRTTSSSSHSGLEFASGNYLAAAHVAGISAIFRGWLNPTFSASDITHVVGQNTLWNLCYGIPKDPSKVSSKDPSKKPSTNPRKKHWEKPSKEPSDDPKEPSRDPSEDSSNKLVNTGIALSSTVGAPFVDAGVKRTNPDNDPNNPPGPSRKGRKGKNCKIQ